MTKQQLLWRFKELPTAGEIADLVAQEVITKEEARNLLFNDKKGHDVAEENKALKEQIEFLQDTVDKLIDKLSGSHTYHTFTNTYTPNYPTKYWISAGRNADYNLGGGSVMLCATGGSTGGTIGLASSTVNANAVGATGSTDLNTLKI